ncbi:hypothetical protein [Salinivibrio sp. ML198]|uniref:hypothetical protein n=1 Tax=Salinivibrio sp. ML198 TaxID=1909458 RepID=UPI0010561F42|nr:hypothetical protein [Salinivibrio sp. ML198]
MTDFYLDIYSLPSIDYQEKCQQGLCFSEDDFKKIVEDLYCFLSIYDDDQTVGTVIRISKKILIINIANFIKMIKIKKDILSKGLSIRYLDKVSFVERAGGNGLAGSYIADFFEENTLPLIKPYKEDLVNPLKDNLKRFASNLKLFTGSALGDRVVVFNGNPWLYDYLEKEGVKYTKVHQSLFFPCKKNDKENTLCSDDKIIRAIEIFIRNVCSHFSIEDKKEENTLRKIVYSIMSKAERDFNESLKYLDKKKLNFKEVYSGTCGNYFTRVIFEVLKRKGIKTNATMHSGAIRHLDYPFDPRLFIEYEIPDNFYVFNKIDADFLNKKYSNRLKENFFKPMREIETENSCGRHYIVDAKKIRKVIYVGTCSPGGIQFYGVDDDLRKISYENTLLEKLVKDGYEVIFKVHPKGAKYNRELIEKKYPTVSFVYDTPIEDLASKEDSIFIFKMIDSTAFNQVLSTDSPAIVVSENQRQLLSIEAADILKNRVSFVDCFYENGLAKIDVQQLDFSLNKKYISDGVFSKKFQ